MDWLVQYRKDGTDHVERHPTPEDAIETACQLIDEGSDVYGIGAGSLSDSIGRDEIAKIYNIWLKEKLPFGRI